MQDELIENVSEWDVTGSEYSATCCIDAHQANISVVSWMRLS